MCVPMEPLYKIILCNCLSRVKVMTFWFSEVSIHILSDLFASQPSVVPCGPDVVYFLIHWDTSPSCKASCKDQKMISFVLMVFYESCIVIRLGLFAKFPHPLNPNTVFVCVSQGIQSAMSPLKSESFQTHVPLLYFFQRNLFVVLMCFSVSCQFPYVYNYVQCIVLV